MSYSMRGISGLDPRPGEYRIEPSEMKEGLSNPIGEPETTDDGEEVAMYHIQNVVDADGEVLVEVLDDRRTVEGLSVEGQQFLFRSPDGEHLMALQREGAVVGSAMTLVDVSTGEELATCEMTSQLSRSWELRSPTDETVAVGKRKWGLRSLLYPRWAMTEDDGTAIGRLAMSQSGLNYEMDVTLERSSIPTEVLLAWAYGMFWAASEA